MRDWSSAVVLGLASLALDRDLPVLEQVGVIADDLEEVVDEERREAGRGWAVSPHRL